VILLGVAGPTWAQEAEAEADRLMHQGVDLRRQGKDLEALPFLQRAYAVFPSSKSGAQLGFVEQSLGLSLEAERHVSGALSDESDSWVQKNRTTIAKALQQIRAGLGRLVIKAEPPGVTVSINGATVAPRDLQKPVYVKPGSTLVEARRDGFGPQSKTVTVLAGTTQNIELSLAPVSSPQPSVAGPIPMPPSPGLAAGPGPGAPPVDMVVESSSAGHGRTVAGIALLSLGAVAAVGATTSLLIANDKLDSLEKDAHAEAHYNESNGSFTTFQRLSQVLYVTAGASAIAGGLLFWSGASSDSSHTSASLRPTLVGLATPGLSLAGRF
jgi:hypothetical protein